MKAKFALPIAKKVLAEREGTITYTNEGLRIDFIYASDRIPEINSLVNDLMCEFTDVRMCRANRPFILITL